MEQTKIDDFSDMKIKIGNGTGEYQGERTDYSKLVFTEDSPYPADCIGVKRAEVKVWEKPNEVKTVLRFVFRLIDDNGLPAILSKDCTPSVTYGSMRSNLFKVLKALFPLVSEEEFQDEALVKARLADISLGEGREICLPCMIVIKYGTNKFIKIDSVLADPSVKKTKPKKEVKTGFESKDDFDKDEIPF